MIFAIPEVFKGIGYYQGISLILWIIAISLTFLSSALFAFRALKTEEKGPKMANIAYCIFLVFFGLTRIVYIIAVYNPLNYDFYTILGYIFFISGIIFWIYILETFVITSTKKILLISNLIVFAIILIALMGATSRYFALTFVYIFSITALFVVLIIYLYIIINTRNTARKKAIGVFVGLILISLAHFMDSELFIFAFPALPLEITPIVLIGGIFTFTWSQLFLKPK